MPEHNLGRFYFDKFQRAHVLWNLGYGDVDAADDMCCELVSEFQCPRLLQVQAYQLRSLCTENYWLAKRHLSRAMDIIVNLDNQEHPMIKEYKTHTEKMMGEVVQKLEMMYEAKGQEVPDEQPTGAFESDPAEEMGQLSLQEMKEGQGLSDQETIEQGGLFVPASQDRHGGPPLRGPQHDGDEELAEDEELAWKGLAEPSRMTLEAKAPLSPSHALQAAEMDIEDAMDVQLPLTPPPTSDFDRMEE